MRKQRKTNPVVTILLVVLLLILIGIAAVSGLKLYRYYADYSKDRDLYQDLRDDVVDESEETEAEQATKEETEEETEEYRENGILHYRKKLRKRSPKVPVKINWEKLKKINEDIHQCKGQITCNIGRIIDEIRKDDGK